MKMKLVNEKTGEALLVGDTVTTFRGEVGTLTACSAPRHEGSSGRVYVKFSGGFGYEASYYPSVIGAKFVEVK
jgi:hypothetical protein